MVSTDTDLSPVVMSVDEGSAAASAGLVPGDVIRSVQGLVPRDVIEWHRLVDEPRVELTVGRGGLDLDIIVTRQPDEPFGVTVSSAVFDRVQTCDNHCEFCFIYQLPKGMRRSLYTKDDDYRLSFLFGNFTTLTRFTEADLERVVDERLSPLFVSVHATDPAVRSGMLRNERGGVSLRWLGEMLARGIEVNVQIVLCPGVNDGVVLEDTLAGILERFPAVSNVAVVPLGLSRHNTEVRMRVHTSAEALEAVMCIEKWAGRFLQVLGRRVVHAADELYLRAGLEVPVAAEYGDFGMLEDGIGLVRSFVEAYVGRRDDRSHHNGGFFSAVDASPYVRSANPAVETGLRRVPGSVPVTMRRSRGQGAPLSVRILSGELAAPVIRRLVSDHPHVEVVAVRNGYFGGNTAVAGLLTFEDVSEACAKEPRDALFLLPDVCLNAGTFLDGHTIDELTSRFDVEVVPASGALLRERLELFRRQRERVCGD
ncbi:MAG: hypothetical protein RLZZ305_1098 [Actinomycetota bacterium]